MAQKQVREGRLRPELLRSHLKARISLNIYDTLIYDIPKDRRLSHLSTDIRHINRPILILGKTEITFLKFQLYFLNSDFSFNNESIAFTFL